MAALFSDTAKPAQGLLDKPPAEVYMDDIYDTFMPYLRKGKTVRGELSTYTVCNVASSSIERGIDVCMKIQNRESNV